LLEMANRSGLGHEGERSAPQAGVERKHYYKGAVRGI
jgi:hypothetical protein